ncbi:hypothetical protein A2483_05590 [Candidatus Peregrinibacteria bacterium RIFOXYC2_FULL_33_13]|nr:MAG: hypothetical protein A2483_05590 [Candidatus Peregrinibacteria bacterium RIFOXYC2_FULL_33_13]
MQDLVAKIKHAIENDPVIIKNPEISAIRDELLQMLKDPLNLEFGILKNEDNIPTTNETGRYLAGLAIKRAPNNSQGAVRMPVLPNHIAEDCSFDNLFESLGPDGYRKLIASSCLKVLEEIQNRRSVVDPYYNMTMRGSPSGTYRGNKFDQHMGNTSFSQSDVDNHYEKRAKWLLQRLKDGESPFSVVQPFKKIRSMERR